MKNNEKTFAYYCSDGASRILKFYSYPQNSCFQPKVIIYDGGRDTVIKQLRDLFGDRLFVIERDKLKQEEKNRIHNYTSEYIHKLLKKYDIEYLICFGNKILKKKLISDYKNKLINFHPALLPSFKGLNAIDKALEHSVDIIGNTAHYIDEGIDTGKIIIQSAMLSNDFESYEDVLELQLPMLKIIFRDILNFNIKDKDLFLELEHRKSKYIISSNVNNQF